MKTFHRFILIIYVLFSWTHSQQQKTSIHQEQSSFYKNQTDPITDKVNVKTGLDILLNEKIDILKNQPQAIINVIINPT